jgi:hypothetical protein
MTSTPFISRRNLLGAALAAGAAWPFVGAGRASATAGPQRLVLPAPTGPHPVGTTALHLVDRSRPGPAGGPGLFHELMAGVWYPARDVARHPLAPWTAPAVIRELLTSAGFEPDVVTAPATAGHGGAPVRRGSERLPVIVFSHGAHDHRADTTVAVQELASHGYVVLTVDHTYDAISEFPDGRVIVPVDDPVLGPRDFARDIRFVLDTVESLAAGCNPDAGGRPLPDGLGGALDPRRIGVFGWSKGGTATAFAMSEDERVRAGLSLDGPMLPRLGTELHRPFMMMTAEFTRDAEPGVAEFWSLLRGWRLDIRAEGAVHSSYTDYQALYPQLARVVGMSGEQLAGLIGTLAPTRAVRIQQAYPLAFFDLHLRRRRSPLLDGPSPAFPEVRFVP